MRFANHLFSRLNCFGDVLFERNIALTMKKNMYNKNIGGEIKKRVLLLSFLLTFCLAYSVYGEEISPFKNKFSIGINDLPWNASTISFRWWKNKDRGSELSIGRFSGKIEKENDELNLVADISEIRYDWLRRKKCTLLENSYTTRGIGIASTFRGSFHGESRKVDFSFYIRFPIGFEHFFLKRYPNISYSLQADFYSGLGYEHSAPYNVNVAHLYLGVAPRFFFRFYFR